MNITLKTITEIGVELIDVEVIRKHKIELVEGLPQAKKGNEKIGKAKGIIREKRKNRKQNIEGVENFLINIYDANFEVKNNDILIINNKEYKALIVNKSKHIIQVEGVYYNG